MKYYLLAFVCIVLCLCSCSSLQEVRSYEEGKETIVPYPYANTRHQLRYRITNTEEVLHIQINTSNRMSIMKMLKGGFTLYFDLNAKKNKNLYFQYPLENVNAVAAQGKGRGENSSKADVGEMLIQIPVEAMFHSPDTQFTFNVQDTSLINAKIIALTKTEILYDLSIPFKMLNPSGIRGIENLSVGFESGSLQSSSKGGGAPAESAVNMNNTPGGMNPGGVVGGNPNNRRPGGGGAHTHQPVTNAGQGVNNPSDPVKMWFNLQLHRK